ncbi:MAG: Sec-independent protein translocase protein TatB [Pseudomonadota bacterium]
MFDIGWDEMALVAVIALIVIGPKDLPHVLRTAGQWVRKARSLAGEFQRGVDEMVREAELHDLKSQVEKAADTNSLKRQIEATIDPTGDIARGLEAPRLEAPKETDSADMGSWNEPQAAQPQPAADQPKPQDDTSRPPQP